ncbi:hypothetical protein [Pedobacter sp.]
MLPCRGSFTFMKETILTLAARELLERQAEISAGNVSLGCIYLIGKRIWIMRRYVQICRDKQYLPELGIFSMLGEYEMLKIRLKQYLVDGGPRAGDKWDRTT